MGREGPNVWRGSQVVDGERELRPGLEASSFSIIEYPGRARIEARNPDQPDTYVNAVFDRQRHTSQS
jgi:hypothetical protein